jgi:hypothetical protein
MIAYLYEIMLTIALDKAAETTIVFLGLWAVFFPALVTGLIALALYQTYVEHRQNVENRRGRR